MKIGLGSAQFGLAYGATNRHGKLQDQAVAEIVAEAFRQGVDLIDTAFGYGDAETRLGALPEPGINSFRVVTKTKQLKKNKIKSADAIEVLSAFQESLAKLRRSDVDCLMVHSAQDLLAEGGEFIYEILLDLRAQGKIKKVGVSVYSAIEIDQLFKRFQLDLIQLPFNIFDQRLLQTNHLSYLEDKGIEIHARSIFLQGLLVADTKSIPNNLKFIEPQLERFRKFTEANNISPMAAALDFVKKFPAINYGIFGVTRAAELTEIILQFRQSTQKSSIDYRELSVSDEMIVDPSKWPPGR